MSEIGVVLMPLYAIFSWAALVTQENTGKYALVPVALVGWVWAGINIYRTNRFDLGIITFFFVLLSALAERQCGSAHWAKRATGISCLLVVGNYSLVVIFWEEIQQNLAKSKGVVWLDIFWLYCIAMLAFWVSAVAKLSAGDFHHKEKWFKTRIDPSLPVYRKLHSRYFRDKRICY